MRILITRPSSDSQATAALLAAAGHVPLQAPLLATRWRDGPALDLAGVAAILATSANGVRALARRTARRDLPLFAVGPQTAQQGRDAGFVRVKNADGDARALAQAVPGWIGPEAGVLLHACGAQGAGGLAQRLTAGGYAVRREILYAVEALAMPAEAREALRRGAVDGALFFSPRSAQVFAAQAQGLPLCAVTAFCISAATAAALDQESFGRTLVAARPNQQALLALLDRSRDAV